MKETYFKIVELPTHQILLEKDFDNESDEDVYLIVITFHIKDVKIKNTHGYSNEDVRNKAFEAVTDEQLQNTLDYNLNLFN